MGPKQSYVITCLFIVLSEHELQARNCDFQKTFQTPNDYLEKIKHLDSCEILERCNFPPESTDKKSYQQDNPKAVANAQILFQMPHENKHLHPAPHPHVGIPYHYPPYQHALLVPYHPHYAQVQSSYHSYIFPYMHEVDAARNQITKDKRPKKPAKKETKDSNESNSAESCEKLTQIFIGVQPHGASKNKSSINASTLKVVQELADLLSKAGKSTADAKCRHSRETRHFEEGQNVLPSPCHPVLEEALLLDENAITKQKSTSDEGKNRMGNLHMIKIKLTKDHEHEPKSDVDELLQSCNVNSTQHQEPCMKTVFIETFPLHEPEKSIHEHESCFRNAGTEYKRPLHHYKSEEEHNCPEKKEKAKQNGHCKPEIHQHHQPEPEQQMYHHYHHLEHEKEAHKVSKPEIWYLNLPQSHGSKPEHHNCPAVKATQQIEDSLKDCHQTILHYNNLPEHEPEVILTEISRNHHDEKPKQSTTLNLHHHDHCPHGTVSKPTVKPYPVLKATQNPDSIYNHLKKLEKPCQELPCTKQTPEILHAIEIPEEIEVKPEELHGLLWYQQKPVCKDNYANINEKSTSQEGYYKPKPIYITIPQAKETEQESTCASHKSPKPFCLSNSNQPHEVILFQVQDSQPKITDSIPLRRFQENTRSPFAGAVHKHQFKQQPEEVFMKEPPKIVFYDFPQTAVDEDDVNDKIYFPDEPLPCSLSSTCKCQECAQYTKELNDS